jgi:hypothetical protein
LPSGSGSARSVPYEALFIMRRIPWAGGGATGSNNGMFEQLSLSS